MGVSIYVGSYASCLKYDPDIALTMERQFREINIALAERGIEQHNEPNLIFNMNNRAAANNFSYGNIYQLRQFYMDSIEGSPSESHLVCHSDFDGYYVPVAFNKVIQDKRVHGTWLCSSYELMKELIIVAPELGISLSDGILCDEQAEVVNNRAWSRDILRDELIAWIALYEAARLSIEYKSAIVFR